MGTALRARLSINNKYYVETHRYYELKHFCLQYHNWRKEYRELDGFTKTHKDPKADHDDPTYNITEKRLLYLNKMKLVEQTAITTDSDIHSYILKAVTEGRSYNYLKTMMNIPCGKDLYYDRYRRFFWLLDKARD